MELLFATPFGTVLVVLCLGNTLRQRLIAARKAKAMTQEQLAYKTGLDRSHIGYIEQAGKQQRKPTVSTLVKLCQALDINLEQLFKGL